MIEILYHPITRVVLVGIAIAVLMWIAPPEFGL